MRLMEGLVLKGGLGRRGGKTPVRGEEEKRIRRKNNEEKSGKKESLGEGGGSNIFNLEDLELVDG